MSVICTVDSSEYWLQLCKKSAKGVVESYKDLKDKLIDTVYVKNSLLIDDLGSLLSQRDSVIVAVAPPFLSLQSYDDSDLSESIHRLTQQIQDLYSLYKKHKNKLSLVPLSAFCSQYTAQSETAGWCEQLIDENEVKVNIGAVISHSLYNQNIDLIRAYKKLQSCFQLKDEDSVFYPNLNKLNEMLVHQAIERQELKLENEKLIEQSFLLLERLEGKEVELNSTAKKHVEELSAAKKQYEEAKTKLTKKHNEANQALIAQHAQDMKAVDDKLKSSKKEMSVLSEQLLSVQNAFVAKEKEFQAFVQSSKKEATINEKTKNREIKQLEAKLERKQATEQQLRAELAELKAIKSTKLWKISSKVEKFSNVVDKYGAKRKKLSQDMGLLYTSDLFDADWYLDTYPDVSGAGLDPAEHYLLYGAKEGRKPSPQFDGKWYLKANPDVAKENRNPLIHYLKFGRAENRSISPVMITHKKNK